jgi:bis(5'-nucleosyl)-tetraphosphatase (symmetrical)
MWIIGDLQGCDDDLKRLLALLPADEPLLFLGDVVNRGPQSLQTLRHVRTLDERAVTLLGNHDLHLLAVAAGIRRLHADDTLQEILDAPDRDDLLDWLRTRPLAHYADGALFVHAGLLPAWTVEQTLHLAAEVEEGLRDGNWRDFLSTMYGNEPSRWEDDLQGADRRRCVINALTRLRFVRADGSMDLKRKGPPGPSKKERAAGIAPGERNPYGLMPWFDHPDRRTTDTTVVFGHWSALGYMNRPDAVCLDTGCVWGKRLSTMRWPDRALVQIPCGQHRVPDWASE